MPTLTFLWCICWFFSLSLFRANLILSRTEADVCSHSCLHACSLVISSWAARRRCDPGSSGFVSRSVTEDLSRSVFFCFFCCSSLFPGVCVSNLDKDKSSPIPPLPLTVQRGGKDSSSTLEAINQAETPEVEPKAIRVACWLMRAADSRSFRKEE